MEKQTTNLYFIRDRLSKVPETAIIQSMNDTVAVRGFQQFLTSNDKYREDNKLPKIQPFERELVHVCELDSENHIVQDNYYVVTRGDRVDDYLKEVLDGLREEE